MSRLVSRSELARLAGVSPAAVSKACKKGLAEAVVGKRVDLDSPLVTEYLRKKGVDPTSLGHFAATGPSGKTSRSPSEDDPAEEADSPGEPGPDDKPPPAPAPPASPESIEAIADLTVREVVERFGTDASLVNYVNALKVIEQTRWQRIKNEREEGRLIPKEYVKTHVLAVIDGANRGLLIDAPKTLARRLYAAAKADVPVEEAEQIAKEINGSHIRAVKDKCVRALRDD